MRIRLKERCFIHGAIREAGAILHLPPGVKGPTRAVRKTHDRIDYDPANGLDANRILGDIVDEPLYDELPDGEQGHTPEQRTQADAAAQASKLAPRPVDPEPPPAEPTVRIRLTAPAFIFGRVHQAGEIVTLPNGMRGPYRTTRQAHERFFARSLAPDEHQLMSDESDMPLFEVLSDRPECHSAEQTTVADDAQITIAHSEGAKR